MVFSCRELHAVPYGETRKSKERPRRVQSSEPTAHSSTLVLRVQAARANQQPEAGAALYKAQAPFYIILQYSPHLQFVRSDALPLIHVVTYTHSPVHT
jgi:hypothetical protein